jgi:4'-phosphopantetheinyl transferase
MCFAGGTVEVVSMGLDAEPAAVNEFALCLSDEERLRASRFVFERDRCRFIVGRARLRYLLASRLGVQPDAIELIYGAHGKPALSRRFAGSDLRFNVSHSEGVAVYAFSHGREIGVDVEALRELRDADDLAARFFSAHENEAYLALRPRDKPVGFLNCWTRKEAFIKALGEGLSHPLDRFDVSLAPGEPAKLLRVGCVSGEACEWTMHELVLGPGFIGAVVAQKHGEETCFKVGSAPWDTVPPFRAHEH